MIKFHHKIHRYGSFFCEILCCDCFFDEVYFLLRKKKMMVKNLKRNLKTITAAL